MTWIHETLELADDLSPRTFSAPISVIPAPVDGAAPEVSRSRTTNVVSANESVSDDIKERLNHGYD